MKRGLRDAAGGASFAEGPEMIRSIALASSFMLLAASSCGGTEASAPSRDDTGDVADASAATTDSAPDAAPETSDEAATADTALDSSAASDAGSKPPCDADLNDADDYWTYCTAACDRAVSCGWEMPLGCSDWCYPSSYSTHLRCIAEAKTCDEAMACLGLCGGE